MNRLKRCMIVWAMVILTGWFLPEAIGDIYRYVDPNGVVHFSNRPSASRYRFYMREARTTLTTDNGDRVRRVEPLVNRAAQRYGLDALLIKAVIKVESDFDPRAMSSKGARGLMQLMPDRARRLGVRDSFDPGENIDGGVRHLRALLDHFEGWLRLALAAYNAGRDAVIQHDGVPPYRETRDYVRKVLEYYAHYQRNHKR